MQKEKQDEVKKKQDEEAKKLAQLEKDILEKINQRPTDFFMDMS